MKTISVRQMATLKRNAQNVYPYLAKKMKLEAQMAQLNAELEEVTGIIEATETGSRIITGGLNSYEVLDRVLVDTGKVDPKTNKPIKQTQYVPNAEVCKHNEDGTYDIVAPMTGEETLFGCGADNSMDSCCTDEGCPMPSEEQPLTSAMPAVEQPAEPQNPEDYRA